MKKSILFFFSILFSLLSYGQNKNLVNPTVLVSFNFEQLRGGWKKYKIDRNIKDSIPKDSLVDDIGPGQVMLQGSLVNSKYQGYHKRCFISFVNYTSGDTTNVIFATSLAEMGYRIIIIGDSCKIFFYGYDTDTSHQQDLMKLNKNGTSYKTELLVPPASYILTLTKKPAFVAGEIIEGHIKFKSQPFYSKSDLPSNLPYEETQLYLDGYFRTFDVKKTKFGKNLPTWFVH